MVQELNLEEESPARLYKRYGVEENGLEEGLFLIVIQTKWQCEIMNRFGQDVMLVDATHRTAARYADFKLITALAVDDHLYGEWPDIFFS